MVFGLSARHFLSVALYSILFANRHALLAHGIEQKRWVRFFA
jgi:hypothetical protein